MIDTRRVRVGVGKRDVIASVAVILVVVTRKSRLVGR
jgi:hypothetical protein